MPYNNWFNGYYDPFVGFVGGLSMHEGDLQTLSPLSAIATDGNKPRNVVYSGRLDTKLSKNCYNVYNSIIINKHGASYDKYSPTK